MPEQNNIDVTVLGSGIVGICTGLALLEKGLQVRLLDRDDPGQATSFGNAGVISPWSVVPQSMPGLWKKVPGWLLDPLGPVTVRPRYLPRLAPWVLRFLYEGRASRIGEISKAMDQLNRDNVSLFRSLLQGTGQEHLLRDSYYVHAFRSAEAAGAMSPDYSMRQEFGASIARIGAGDLRDLEPDLSHDFQAAILLKGQARATSPGRLGAVLADKFRALGGETICEEVTEIRPEAQGEGERGWSYVTASGRHQTPKLVLAMGAWSAQLLKPLGIRIPLEAERGYHVSFADPGVQLSHSVMDMDMKFVASSMEEGLRVAGTAEFAGLDAPNNQNRIKALVKLGQNLLPGLSCEKISTWSGQRPSLPDSLPCIGEIEGFPGLITAFGHSHYGLMMAPKTGRIVADIAASVPANIDLTPYTPNRF
ncbi:NAD(P)/FAD-dependent oxidoreductase [Pseudophaeobacter leonis]|uniref:NAD(P)/FAD-dependent oxidoreductase n=1 Tax=Pseudophaeobacter leonis TaxID=1144477 RepID=UPI0009F5119D|nr:FAD-dependent oxidoreductase [Pseudophaeobacter leonis]